jgi:hypothetical protein
MKRRILPLIIAISFIIPAFIAAKPAYAFDPICDIGQGFFPPLIFTCPGPVKTVSDLLQKNPGQFVGTVITALEQFFINQILCPDNIKNSFNINGSPSNLGQNNNSVGALGGVFLGMKTLYDNTPVSMSQYLASIHPFPTAYAAPTGRSDIFGDTILRFWEAARNLAYLVFIIIIVVIGLMIMFRSKLDPRTTVTATAAIPGLIVALILITFSSALATFMINIGQLIEEAIKNIMLGSIITSQPLISGGISHSVGFTIGDILNRYLLFPCKHLINLGGGTGGAVAAILLDLIIAVGLLIVAIQVFFMLFMRYLYILVKPLYGPFTFLLGGLPGRSSTSVGWFKSYAADILTFPLVLLLLNLGSAMLDSGVGTNPGNNIGQNGDPFGIIEHGADLTSLVVLGILIMCTKVPHFLEVALNTKPDPHIEKGGAQTKDITSKVPFIGGLLGGK